MIAGAHFFSWIESQLLLSRGATRRTLAYGNASFAKRRWTRPKELGPCELLALSSFIRLSSDLSDHDVFSIRLSSDLSDHDVFISSIIQGP